MLLTTLVGISCPQIRTTSLEQQISSISSTHLIPSCAGRVYQQGKKLLYLLLLYLKIGKSLVMEKAGHEMGMMLQFSHE